MKIQLQSLLAQALSKVATDLSLDIDINNLSLQLDRTKDSAHGDYASNIAMVMAKQAKMPPRELATCITAALPSSDLVEKTDIAGPGFINFFLSKHAYHALINEIRQNAQSYGHNQKGNGKKVLLEFVSANPTGPLHVGHGRGAAYGDTLARILRANGYITHAEYYVNDAGRQMDILALSVWLRYLAENGKLFDFPLGAYQGDYVIQMGRQLSEKIGQNAVREVEGLFANLPEDIDSRLDEMVVRAKALLGRDEYNAVFAFGCDYLVNDIREDLLEFGVTFDQWFSERSLLEAGDIEAAIEQLQQAGHLYEQGGAIWFRATDFGDDKDRVVKRANGAYTYFASDMAYHFNKGERGFDQLINIFGADHHGYVTRIKAAYEALGHKRDELDILLVQFAVLYRGGEKMQMSTRSGEFVTLRQLREDVGDDAARFFYVLRKADQHMDFDLDLAKTQSKDNPVYYIQYAHARICRVFEKVKEQGMSTPASETPDYNLLIESREAEIMQMLSRYPEMVELAARDYTPHTIAYYLRDLANAFHAYYDAHPFLASADDLRLARLGLIDAIRAVISNGLLLLGVTAPAEM